MAGMEFSDLRQHLDAEYARLLGAVTIAPPDARVPTCPDWTATDLAHHVATVYLHKAEAIRLGAWPDPWPPDLAGTPAPDALDRGWSALIDQLDRHQPHDPAKTWFDPDQSVGFWVRRMAHETVIHRIDAELAAGSESAPIEAAFGLDTVDEVLSVFVDWASKAWPEDFQAVLTGADSRVLEIAAPARTWFVVATADGVAVGDTAPAGVATTVRGEPDALARWLWNRGDDGIEVAGDAALAGQFKRVLAVATQ